MPLFALSMHLNALETLFTALRGLNSLALKIFDLNQKVLDQRFYRLVASSPLDRAIEHLTAGTTVALLKCKYLVAGCTLMGTSN